MGHFHNKVDEVQLSVISNNGYESLLCIFGACQTQTHHLVNEAFLLPYWMIIRQPFDSVTLKFRSKRA